MASVVDPARNVPTGADQLLPAKSLGDIVTALSLENAWVPKDWPAGPKVYHEPFSNQQLAQTFGEDKLKVILFNYSFVGEQLYAYDSSPETYGPSPQQAQSKFRQLAQILADTVALIITVNLNAAGNRQSIPHFLMVESDGQRSVFASVMFLILEMFCLLGGTMATFVEQQRAESVLDIDTRQSVFDLLLASVHQPMVGLASVLASCTNVPDTVRAKASRSLDGGRDGRGGKTSAAKKGSFEDDREESSRPNPPRVFRYSLALSPDSIRDNYFADTDAGYAKDNQDTMKRMQGAATRQFELYTRNVTAEAWAPADFSRISEATEMLTDIQRPPVGGTQDAQAQTVPDAAPPPSAAAAAAKPAFSSDNTVTSDPPDVAYAVRGADDVIASISQFVPPDADPAQTGAQIIAQFFGRDGPVADVRAAFNRAISQAKTYSEREIAFGRYVSSEIEMLGAVFARLGDEEKPRFVFAMKSAAAAAITRGSPSVLTEYLNLVAQVTGKHSGLLEYFKPAQSRGAVDLIAQITTTVGSGASKIAGLAPQKADAVLTAAYNAAAQHGIEAGDVVIKNEADVKKMSILAEPGKFGKPIKSRIGVLFDGPTPVARGSMAFPMPPPTGPTPKFTPARAAATAEEDDTGADDTASASSSDSSLGGQADPSELRFEDE